MKNTASEKTRKSGYRCLLLAALVLLAAPGMTARAEGYTADAPASVTITTKDGSGSRLQKSDGYVSAVMEAADPEGNPMLSGGEGKIKVRGNSTAAAPKKPYTFKLGDKADLMGFGAAKKWVLLADCFDPTRMRNSLAFDLAGALEVPYVPQYTAVTVTLDGAPQGLYMLTEGVNTGRDRLDIDTKKGDFLLEYEKEREESGVTYIKTSAGLRFAFSEPEEPSGDQIKHVSEVLEGVEKALESGSWESVASQIDVPSFAAYYLLNEYLGNADFFVSSTYFFCRGGKLYAGPCWDFDMSAGNLNPSIDTNYEVHASTEGLHAVLGWYPSLMKYAQFKYEVRRLLASNASAFTDLYRDGGAIDRFMSANSAALAEDLALWPVSERYTEAQRQPDGSYEENVAYLREWLRARHEYLVRTL